MTQEEWEESITTYMTNGGWTKDRDDETTLGFSFIEGQSHWMRDYDKKERRFVQFDGNVRVNLKVSQ
jgi:hypothetical protein